MPLIYPRFACNTAIRFGDSDIGTGAVRRAPVVFINPGQNVHRCSFEHLSATLRVCNDCTVS